MAHASTATAAGSVWLRRMVRAKTTALHPDESGPGVDALDEFLEPLQGIEPAGDLTGNGHKDVLDERLVFVHGQFTTGLTARDGRTGRTLWARTVSGANRVALPLDTARVGPVAGRGVLVVVATASSVSATVESLSEVVEAWSGATGKTLWTSTPVTGTISKTTSHETDTGVPTTPDAIHALPGVTEDALLPVESSTTSETSGEGHGSATATLVNGRTGAETTPYSALTSTTSVPTLQPVADLDGDGRSDVIAITPGRPGSLTAEAGSTGKRLWRRSLPLGAGASVSSVGRVSGGSAPDHAVSGEELRLVRGRDGKVLWFRRHGARHSAGPPNAFRLGPAGPNGTPAVLLASDVGTDGKKRFSTGVVFRAVSATGRRIWSLHISRSARISGGFGGSIVGYGLVGDVQPDGSTDFEVVIELETGHHNTTLAGIVSGRDGRFQRVPGGSLFMWPTAGSLEHGSGVDLLSTRAVHLGIKVSGYDGLTGRPLVQTVVPRRSGGAFAYSVGLRVSGHSCSDIALFIGERHYAQDDLLSGSGHRLWQLRFGTNQATGGHLTRYSAPHHFCAA